MRVRWRNVALGVGAVAVLGVGGFYGWMELVKAGVLRYNKYDRRERGSLKVGFAAPDLTLAAYDGRMFSLSVLWAKKPVVLVFGSCT
jgi:hypothetical protein